MSSRHFQKTDQDKHYELLNISEKKLQDNKKTQNNKTTTKGKKTSNKSCIF